LSLLGLSLLGLRLFEGLSLFGFWLLLGFDDFCGFWLLFGLVLLGF